MDTRVWRPGRAKFMFAADRGSVPWGFSAPHCLLRDRGGIFGFVQSSFPQPVEKIIVAAGRDVGLAYVSGWGQALVDPEHKATRHILYPRRAEDPTVMRQFTTAKARTHR